MPLNEQQARDKAIETLHKLIESQSVHLSGSGSSSLIDTHAQRGKIDTAYLDAFLKGLIEIYRSVP
ncbi:hypothetical protein [Burkholderia pseudomallei]|uniref:hypothetical protein n=1 Tax=Burkholderia pseudomallei TaxID=28450 RepID=UPI0012F4A00E|nr:hypothetical protein [Burkholderia pseudomallei]